MFIACKLYHSSQASISVFFQNIQTFPNLLISCSQTPLRQRQFTINTLRWMQRRMKVICSLWLSWSLGNKQTADSIQLKKTPQNNKNNKPTKPSKTNTNQPKNTPTPHYCPLSLISHTSQEHYNGLSSTSPLKHKPTKTEHLFINFSLPTILFMRAQGLKKKETDWQTEKHFVDHSMSNITQVRGISLHIRVPPTFPGKDCKQ